MCLVCINKPELKTAEEDIVCYKVVRENMKSPVYDFQYKCGKTYHTELCTFPCTNFHHFLDDILTQTNKSKKIKYDLCWDVNRGFHSFGSWFYDWLNDNNLQIQRFYNWRNLYNQKVKASVILVCVIPKGSRYYSEICLSLDGSFQTYVSDTIKVLNII